MSICQLCKKEDKVMRFRLVHGVEIYECSRCQLAFVNQEKSRETNNRSFYHFDEYRTRERDLTDRYRTLAMRLANYVRIRNKTRARILEIGAGFGLFSSLLNRLGNFEIEVIEPTVTPYYLKGTEIKIYRTTLEEFFETKRKLYDVIVMMDVLEHFKDALTNLRKLRSLVGKDGLIIIQTPNYRSAMTYLCRDWSWWMVEDHKFILSPRSIKKLSERAGFRLQELSTYESLRDFLKNLDGNFSGIRNPVIRKIYKGIILSVFLIFYLPLRQFIWRLGYGGLIWCILSSDENPSVMRNDHQKRARDYREKSQIGEGSRR